MQNEPAGGAPLERRVRPVSEARWCVEDSRTGMQVAQGSALCAETAASEATHYAVQYAQDHPVRWWVRQDRKTLMQGSLEGVSVTVRGSVGDLLKAIGNRLA